MKYIIKGEPLLNMMRVLGKFGNGLQDEASFSAQTIKQRSKKDSNHFC